MSVVVEESRLVLMVPVFEMLKSVVVEVRLDDPTAKRVWLVPPNKACTERLAKGEELPTPRKPAEVIVVVPVCPKEATLARRLLVNSLVEVAFWSDVLPATVSVPLAFNAPPILRSKEMVVEPVTASAVVVAPAKVAPPLKAICVEVALLGKRYENSAPVLVMVSCPLANEVEMPAPAA